LEEHDITPRPLADLVNLDRLPRPPGRRPHQRRFDAASEIQVLERGEATTSENVHMQPVGIGVYSPIPKRATEHCRHVTSICRACRRQWEQDHFLGVFTHGTPTAYSNQGCRCSSCREACTTYRTTRPEPPPAS
jgi:hypothetical protein